MEILNQGDTKILNSSDFQKRHGLIFIMRKAPDLMFGIDRFT
jgi:hypothetical protein